MTESKEMTESREQIILVFSSTHMAMKAERSLQGAQWPSSLVPVPPSVNEGCGVGIQIAVRDLEEIAAYLKEAGIIPVMEVELD